VDYIIHLVKEGTKDFCLLHSAINILVENNVPPKDYFGDPLAVVDAAALALVCRKRGVALSTVLAPAPFLQAGVLIHEMFHLRFPPFFQHCSKERRGTCAYCFDFRDARRGVHATSHAESLQRRPSETSCMTNNLMENRYVVFAASISGMRPTSSFRNPPCSCAERRTSGFLAAVPASNPVFRLECPTGRPPALAAQCRNTVYVAAREAIRLCVSAASKLDTRDGATVNHFVRSFGHDPSRPVPWGGNRASGAIVAYRLRKVAEGLHGRVVHFRCVGPGARAPVNARTNWQAEPNVINLCARFWNPPAALPLPVLSFRGGVILHEMLHLLFHSFFHHAGHPSGDPERHRDNSHCYEAFTLLADGKRPEQGDLDACARRPF
jgi:hypothetical protein